MRERARNTSCAQMWPNAPRPPSTRLHSCILPAFADIRLDRRPTLSLKTDKAGPPHPHQCSENERLLNTGIVVLVAPRLKLPADHQTVQLSTSRKRSFAGEQR